MLSSEDAHCTFQPLADGIYEIRIHQATRRAVEEFFHHLRVVYDEALAKAALPVRILIVAPDSALPVLPLTAELKKWTAHYGQVASRHAILYEGLFGTMVDILVRNFGNRVTQMRVFKPAQRQTALDWISEK
jgi:hypothetical protein